MIDVHDPRAPRPTISDRRAREDFSGAAFAAAIAEALGRIRSWLDWFGAAAEDVAGDCDESLEAYMRAFALANAAQEAAIRQRFADAGLDPSALAARARAHGIAFSSTAEAHHRAAILDYRSVRTDAHQPQAPVLVPSDPDVRSRPVDDKLEAIHGTLPAAGRSRHRA